MPIKVTQVDSFTTKPFSGNPAAVCILDKPADEEWMQSVAAEMNLSETAYLHPEADGYRLRWFTPEAEVDLCGHATLASAHVVWEEGHSQADVLKFHTLSGLLTVQRNGDWMEMNFPVDPLLPADVPAELLAALGAKSVFAGKTRIRHFVELESPAALRALTPDLGAIKKVPPGRVLVTAKSDDPGFDFICRYFGPGVGVPEDPVTGSAYCALAPYWSKKLGKAEFTGYQASKRGGVVRVRLEGDRVFISGQAVTVMRAELLT
jgi:PhzF family phenazine biosynthesis protein